MRQSRGAKERADTRYNPYSPPRYAPMDRGGGVVTMVKVSKGIPRTLDKDCIKARRKNNEW